MIDKISQCIGGNKMNECAFGTKDPVYLDYHDHVWGQLLYDSKALFKLLALESQHAGLSWLTILKRKKPMKKHFMISNQKGSTNDRSRYRPLNDFSKYRSSS